MNKKRVLWSILFTKKIENEKCYSWFTTSKMIMQASLRHEFIDQCQMISVHAVADKSNKVLMMDPHQVLGL